MSCELDLALARSPTRPGITLLIASVQVVLGVRVDLRDPADDEERQRQDREERQEREVGDRAGLLAGLDRAVVLLHPHHVVDERPPLRTSATRASTRSWSDGIAQPAAPWSGKSRVGCQPASLVVDVEVEAGDVELALEVGQLVERPVEQRRRSRWWAIGDVRVVREAAGRRRAAPGVRRRRAARTAEMPSTRVTNTTGETGRKVPVPRRCTQKLADLGGDLLEVLLDLGAARRRRSRSAAPA